MDTKVYDLLEKMYIEFNQRFESLENKFSGLEDKFSGLENKFSSLEDNTNQHFTSLEDKLSSLEDNTNQRFTKLEDNTNQRFTDLDRTTSEIKYKVDKNTVLLENLDTKIKTLAEVQSSFSEQLDRSKAKDGKTLGERLDIIELAVTDTSHSVNELLSTIDVIKDITGSHEIDIKILKKHRTSHSF
jgi:chromosome segregation ATPase